MTRSGRSKVVALFTTLSFAAAACGSPETVVAAPRPPVVPVAPARVARREAVPPAATSGGGAARAWSIAIADEPSTLDPQAAEDGNERAVTDNVYDTLLRRDPETNDLVPHLATALPTQIDDTTWEFKLRDGVTFTNGEPFDADAAAYSINRVIDPSFNSAQPTSTRASPAPRPSTPRRSRSPRPRTTPCSRPACTA